MVFTVGDENDRAGHFTGITEPLDGFANGLFEPRSAARDALRPGLIEDQTQESEVWSERRKYGGTAGKRDQPDLVAFEVGKQVTQVRLGPFETVGGDVLGQHRA